MVLAVVMAVVLVFVVMTMIEAFRRWRAVDDTDLERFAWVKMMRSATLTGTMMVTSGIYLLVVVFPPPRSQTVNALMVLGVLGVTIGVALLGIHEYVEMRMKFNGRDG